MEEKVGEVEEIVEEAEIEVEGALEPECVPFASVWEDRS